MRPEPIHRRIHGGSATTTPPTQPEDATQSQAQSAAPQQGRSFVLHARLVSLMTLGSRVLGLLRDATMAWLFGMTGLMDAFVIAFMIPNLFRRLFGEGSLAGAFIPHYSKLDEKNPSAARRFLNLTLSRMSALLFSIYGLALMVMLFVLFFMQPEFKWALPLRLTTITLAYMPLVCLVAILGAALQCHQKFGPPAAAPILLNIMIISAALGTGIFHETLSAEHRLMLVCVAILLAGLIQVIWQWLALKMVKQHWADTSKTVNAQLSQSQVKEAWRGLLKQWGPTTLGLAVLQLNTLADVLIVMIFSSSSGQAWQLGNMQFSFMPEGSVATLNGAQRLFQFPLGVFGIAVATAIFPALSRQAHRRAAFGKTLRQGLRLTFFIGLPASIGMLIVSRPLAEAIFYQGGELTAQDAINVAHVLQAYAPAVLGYSVIQILTRAFYAQHDPITPLKLSMLMVGLNLCLNLTLIWPFGVAGVGWSTCICAAVQCIALLFLIRKITRYSVTKAVWKSWSKTTLLSLLMGGIILGLLLALNAGLSSWDIGRLKAILLCIVITAVGALVAAVMSRFLKMPELRWILGRKVS